MPKKTKNTPFKDNQGRSSLIFDVHKRENVKKNRTKVILKKDDQGANDYFLYHSISKY